MRGGPSGRGLLPPPHPLPPAPRLDTVQAGEPSASDRWRDAKVQACASTPEGQSLVPFVASALQRLQVRAAAPASRSFATSANLAARRRCRRKLATPPACSKLWMTCTTVWRALRPSA